MRPRDDSGTRVVRSKTDHCRYARFRGAEDSPLHSVDVRRDSAGRVRRPDRTVRLLDRGGVFGKAEKLGLYCPRCHGER